MCVCVCVCVQMYKYEKKKYVTLKNKFRAIITQFWNRTPLNDIEFETLSYFFVSF